jgi:hypothetical protein
MNLQRLARYAPHSNISKGLIYIATGTSAQLIKLTRHLKFPQCYEAMIATFGAPQQRSQRYDYYRISNGQYVAGEYRRVLGYEYR